MNFKGVFLVLTKIKINNLKSVKIFECFGKLSIK